MKVKSSTEKIISILSAVVFGAISSGLWEKIVKPIFEFGQIMILNVIGFFFKTYSDAIYSEISLGFHERMSLQLYALFIVCLTGTTCILMYYSYKLYKKRFEEIKNRSIKNDVDNKQEKKPFAESIGLSNFHPFKLKVAFFLMVSSTSLLFIQMTADIYINKAITYHQVSLKILKPGLSEKELDQLVSKFSQIKNRAMYEQCIKELENESIKQKVELPKFNIW